MPNIELYQQMTQDEYDFVRRTAVQAIRKLVRDNKNAILPSQVYNLVFPLTKDICPTVRTCAYQTLQITQGRNAMRILINALLTDSDHNVVRQAAECLAEIADPYAIPMLEKAQQRIFKDKLGQIIPTHTHIGKALNDLRIRHKNQSKY